MAEKLIPAAVVAILVILVSSAAGQLLSRSYSSLF